MSFLMTHHNQLTTLSDISIFQVQPSIETRSTVPLLFVRLPSSASNSLTTLAQEAASHSSLITLDQTESVQAIKSFPASTHIILITPNPSPAIYSQLGCSTTSVLWVAKIQKLRNVILED